MHSLRCTYTSGQALRCMRVASLCKCQHRKKDLSHKRKKKAEEEGNVSIRIHTPALNLHISGLCAHLTSGVCAPQVYTHLGHIRGVNKSQKGMHLKVYVHLMHEQNANDRKIYGDRIRAGKYREKMGVVGLVGGYLGGEGGCCSRCYCSSS